jgi:hypothetical protein
MQSITYIPKGGKSDGRSRIPRRRRHVAAQLAQLVLISPLIAARRPSTHPSTGVPRSAFPSIPKAPAAPTR